MKRKLALIAVVLVCAACAAPSEPTVNQDEAVKKFVAEIDHETHQVKLPIDQYLASDYEQAINDAALYLNVDLCMGEQGYPVKWTAPEDRYEVEEWRRYGRWDMSVAVEFGHLVADNQAVAEIKEWEAQASKVLSTDEAQNALEGCVKDRKGIPYISTIMGTLPGEIQALSSSSYDQMMASTEAKQVFDDWHVCLESQGLKAGQEDSAFLLDGVSFDTTTEEDIRTAVLNVKCREETDFIARLAAIEAAIQAPIVAKYENELVQLRKDIEQAVKDSNNYIKDNSGLLDQFEG